MRSGDFAANGPGACVPAWLTVPYVAVYGPPAWQALAVPAAWQYAGPGLPGKLPPAVVARLQPHPLPAGCWRAAHGNTAGVFLLPPGGDRPRPAAA